MFLTSLQFVLGLETQQETDMPYYIRSTKGLHGGEMLVEETQSEVRKHMQSNLSVHYSRVSGSEAHRWVKNGQIHGTLLYTDSVPCKSWPYSRKIIRRCGPDSN